MQNTLISEKLVATFLSLPLINENKLKLASRPSYIQCICRHFFNWGLKILIELFIGRCISDMSANLLNVFDMFIEWQNSMNFLGAAFSNLPKTFAFFQLISWLSLATSWKIMEEVLCYSMREPEFLEVSPIYFPSQSVH